ncbi:MAG: hypothetical protein RL885_18005 [Planctomycetota bacterium]
MEILALGIAWYFVFVVSTVCHEASHALLAKIGGDLTAFHGGQVTLNPKPHIQREPMGMVVIPWVIYAMTALGGGHGWMVGWASTPYDPKWAVMYPRRAATMALAGPVSNLLLALLAALAIRLGIAGGILVQPDTYSFAHVVIGADGGVAQGLAVLLSIFFTLNLVLFLFNLLPFPPLDGSGLFGFFLNEYQMARLNQFFHSPGASLIGILIAWKIFPVIFWPTFEFALTLLYPGLVLKG